MESKSELDVVGFSRSGNTCPIAMYLRGRGARFPEVKRYKWIDEFYGSNWRTMPEWGKRFTREIDKITGHSPFSNKLPVIARRALKILDAIGD